MDLSADRGMKMYYTTNLCSIVRVVYTEVLLLFDKSVILSLNCKSLNCDKF